MRDNAASLYQRAARIPVKARIIFGLFLLAAVFLAIHTALTAKDASLHLKLQHSFRSAQVSVWVDNHVAYAGKLTGSLRKRFGLIPTDSAQGNLSQIIPVRVLPTPTRLMSSGRFGAKADNSTRLNGCLSWR